MEVEADEIRQPSEPKTSQRHNNMRMFHKLFLLVFFISALTGCATSEMIGQAKPASFKLSSAVVQWVDRPNMPFKIQTVAVGYGGVTPVPQPPSEEMKSAARTYMRSIANVMQQHSVEDMAAALKAAGINKGQSQTITMTPLDGIYGGAEVFVIVRIDVYDNATRQRWTGFTKATSGTLVLGPHQNPPTREFSSSLASAVMEGFRQANLLN